MTQTDGRAGAPSQQRLPRVAGILLAAGASRRMGTEKLALRLPEGVAIGAHSLAQLRQAVRKLIVVVRPLDSLDWLAEHPVGAARDASVIGSSACTHDADFRIVRCGAATLGMAASLRAGIAEAARLGADGALVALADQPFAGARLLQKLVYTFQASNGADWVAAADGGLPKPPVILSRRLFTRVDELTGDEGARRLLRDPSLRGILVPAEPGCFIDIDTPEDWLNAQRMRL